MTPIDGERSPKADRYAKRLPGGPIKPPRACPLSSTALLITMIAASPAPVRLAVRAARGARPDAPPSWRRDNGRGRHAPTIRSDGGPPARAAARTREREETRMSIPQGSAARPPYQVGDLIHDRAAGFGAYEIKQCEPLTPLLAGASRATHLVTVELPNGMPHHLYVDAAGFTTGGGFGPWPTILDGVAAGGLYDPAVLDKLRAAAAVPEPTT